MTRETLWCIRFLTDGTRLKKYFTVGQQQGTGAEVAQDKRGLLFFMGVTFQTSFSWSNRELAFF